MKRVLKEKEDVPLNKSEWDEKPVDYVDGVPIWIDQSFYTDARGRHEGYNVKYLSPIGDYTSGLSFDLDTPYEEIIDGVRKAIENDKENLREGIQKRFMNYIDEIIDEAIEKDS